MANEEEQESIEGLELESTDNDSELQSSDEVETSKNSESSVESADNVSDESDSQDTPIQGKFSKKKKIIFLAAGVSGALIIILLLLFLFGFFDAEPVKVEEVKMDKKEQMQVVPPKKRYSFSVKDINKKRLNRKLALLTKYEIIEEEKPKVDLSAKAIMPQEVSVDKVEVQENNDTKVETMITHKSEDAKPLEVVKEDLVTPMESKEPEVMDQVAQETNVHEKVAMPIEKETNKIQDVQFETVKKDNQMVQDIINDNINDNTMMEAPIEVDEEAVMPMAETEVSKEEAKPEEMMSTDNDNTLEEIIDEEMTPKEEENLQLSNEDESQKESMDVSQKSFLMFAQVATIKTKLYLSFLQKINKIEKRISVCRNNVNQIEIFVGPFNSEIEREDILNKINSSIVNDAFAIDFTQNEFDKRCKL